MKKLLLIWLLLVQIAWAGAEQASLSTYKPELGAEFIELLRDADPAAGEAIFMRKCASCHDHLKEGGHGKGPQLWNVFFRQAGTQSGFEYSDAMRTSGHTWDFATLNYYLTRTDQAVPGRAMNFRGMRRDSQRAELIKFLWTLNDAPPTLP